MSAIDAAIIKALVEHIGGDSSTIPDGTIGGGGTKYTSGDGISIDGNNKISVDVGPGLSINDLGQIELNIGGGADLYPRKLEAQQQVMTPMLIVDELYAGGEDQITVNSPITFAGAPIKLGGIEDLDEYLENLDARIRALEKQ